MRSYSQRRALTGLTRLVACWHASDRAVDARVQVKFETVMRGKRDRGLAVGFDEQAGRKRREDLVLAAGGRRLLSSISRLEVSVCQSVPSLKL